jgi:hypothetical protein
MLTVKNNFKTFGFFQLKSLGRAKNSIRSSVTLTILLKYFNKNFCFSMFRLFLLID